MINNKRITLSASALLAIWAGVYAAPLLTDCPAPGSGAAGVAAWALDNCGPEACSTTALTCNGEFELELVGIAEEGSHVTYRYDVCQVGGQASLSHWTIDLGGLGCLAEGLDPIDLVIGATLNGEPTILIVGLDPTTQLVGFKFDEGVEGGGCNTFTLTLDASLLAEGFGLGTACGLAATKAGSQDIRDQTRNSPGYACIQVPACVVLETEYEGCSPGFWKNHTEVWILTSFSPLEPVSGVFQGSLYGNLSLLAALDLGGGPGLAGAQKILLRASVAAVLNASDPGVNYPLDVAQVILAVEDALASADRPTILALAAELDLMNNAGCPR